MTIVFQDLSMMADDESSVLGLQTLPSDDPRMENVKRSLQCSLERILATWKLSLFAKSFPTLSSRNEVLVETLRQSILQSTREDLYRGMSELIASELQEPMQQLSALVAECQQPTGVKAWRPTGEPLLDLAAHDAKVLLHERSQLQEAVAKQRRVSIERQELVQSLRYTVLDNDRELKRRLQKLERVRSLCHQLPTLPDQAVTSV